MPKIASSGKISVIMPSYNSAEYVLVAVESIFSQTRPVDEIIVINDGSSDNTKENLEPVIEKIIYLEQEKSGPAAARNLGLKYATGEYIAFLDADDIWMPSKIEKQIIALEKSSETALHYSKYVEFENETGKKTSISPKELYSGQVFHKLLLNPFILMSTVVARAQVFQEIGCFDTSLQTAEDTNFFLRVAKQFNIMGLEEVLVRRRKHSRNLSDRVDVEIGSLLNLDRIVSLFPENDPKNDNIMKKAYISKGTSLINDLFHGENYAYCREVCKRLIRDRMSNPSVFGFFILTFFPPKLIQAMKFYKKGLSKNLCRGRIQFPCI